MSDFSGKHIPMKIIYEPIDQPYEKNSVHFKPFVKNVKREAYAKQPSKNVHQPPLFKVPPRPWHYRPTQMLCVDLIMTPGTRALQRTYFISQKTIKANNPSNGPWKHMLYLTLHKKKVRIKSRKDIIKHTVHFRIILNSHHRGAIPKKIQGRTRKIKWNLVQLTLCPIKHLEKMFLSWIMFHLNRNLSTVLDWSVYYYRVKPLFRDFCEFFLRKIV